MKVEMNGNNNNSPYEYKTQSSDYVTILKGDM